ncbi:uncharacterized protein PV07_12688 [Cladophialophora immunda]|uniref:DUF7587 domain-containing protein n=1 Tax=Cladophialophora immunda TaxID=569365 RepID=A0A0D2AAV8_9EURO|nr:uncharacterized protein PV07_12688 [Cladophialophora immunda]KIW21902.1 hypothetical protein PV07_12688 [Cladophialophora immunda]
MANRTIYTRAYSKTSAGQFISAKGPKGDPLSDTALLEEFRNHANIWNREPTALVSGSDRIVDTLKRAFDKHYEDGESSADIWIAFIEIPPTMNETGPRIHSAKELAEQCELPEPNLFSHEVVFEWAIPKKYVLHEVSLQALINRGLQEHYFLQSSTAEVRRYTARELRQHGPWEIGITLGSFARKFGARAPLDWISHQLFHDCVRTTIVRDDVVRLEYLDRDTEMVDFQFFCDLDDGIDTTLYEWWLSDIDFYLDYEEFKELRDVAEDSMTWDLIEFWEAWRDFNCDGTIKELSLREKLLYDEEKKKLLVEHEKKRAAIEAEAVKIGL